MMLRRILLAITLLFPLPLFAADTDEALVNRPVACINAYTMGTFSEAIIECAMSAHQGNAEAMTFMGGMYYKGLGVELNYLEAVNWYQQAADKGWADAQFSLAKMYEKGHGVAIDRKKAFEYLKKAAAQDHLFAIYNIGYFYGKGYVDGKADYKEAAKWFTKAAERRHPQAMYGLATLYVLGMGVEKDDMKALMWAKLSSKYGVPEADMFADKIKADLTGEQIIKADNMLVDWERQHR